MAKWLILAILSWLASPALAQSSAGIPGYTMPSTQMWETKAENGDVYRIFVSVPAVDPPPDGFPVLYVLDGNAMFAAFAEARRIQEFYDVGKTIVVGVGYPTDKAYDVRRLDDLTPKLRDPPPYNLRRFTQYKSGGQDRFLDFLTGRLRTEIASRYKVNPDRQALFGHSLGGLLALHALFTRPGAFLSIVAASPSLEWNGQSLLDDERAFTERVKSGKTPVSTRLMILVGGRDVDDDPSMAEALFRRMDALSVHGLRTRFHRYEEEGHLSVPVRAVPDVLRYIAESR